MSLFDELKRRNVIRVGGAYLALGWIVTQITATIAPVMHMPEWISQVVVWVGVIGFPFVLLFAWAYELTPEGLKRESEVDRSVSVTHITAHRLDMVTICLVVAAVVLYLVDPLGSGRRAASQQATEAGSAVDTKDAPVATGTAKPAATAQVDPRSIAVLPFVDMSAGKDQEYMSDGIAEELLNLLVKIPELAVTSRSSAFAFKGEKVDLAEVAARLHVAHILEGSVRKSGNKIRITAQLIDARTDKHLWSETYDRSLDDIFAVQDEIAGAVVEQLKIKLLGAAPTATATDARAYALYLQAQQMRRQGNRESMEKAVELFKQALAIDPNYAAAWEGLGANYANLAGNGWLGSFEEGYALARETVDKALAIDPGFGPAHARLGFIAMSYDGDLAAAARHLQRALELAPSDATVLGIASGLAGALGRVEQALAIDALLAERDPVNPFKHLSLGGDHLYFGHSDDAIASFRTALGLSPGATTVHLNIAQALVQKGELDAALAEIQQEPAGVWRLVGLALVQHARSQHAESDAALRELEQKHAEAWSYQIAFVHAFRGEADGAFEWLDKAIALKDPGLAYLQADPMFANITTDPRWLPLLQKLGKAPEQLAAIPFEVNLPR